ncbi:hypothetical protein A6U97_27710 [Agrobacterium tumefaciens]|nr:hypothetical protein A6U97_27710 [Agrobacterium tumefaciens]
MIPLSFTQECLLDTIPKDSMHDAGHTITEIIPMTERYDETTFFSAVGNVIDRHSALRFTLQKVDGEVYNKILPTAHSDAIHVLVCKQAEITLQAINDLIGGGAFELYDRPLAKFYAILTNKNWFILITTHHCISDGRSMEIIYSEILESYQSLIRNEPPIFPIPHQFDRHIISAHERYSRGYLDGDIDHWSTILERCNKPRNRGSTSRHGTVHVRTASLTGEPHIAALKAARSMRVSFFCFFAHSFAVALSKLLSGTPSAIETTFSGRWNEEMETCVGYFSHNAIIATDFLQKDAKHSQIAALSQQLLESLSAQEMPVGYLFVKRKLATGISFPSRDFRIKLQMQNFKKNSPPGKIPSIKDETVETSISSARALRFFLVPYENGIGFRLEYRSDLLTPVDINQLLALISAELAATGA